MLFTLLTQEKCYLRSRSNVITTLTIWRARRKQNKVLSSRNIVISPKQTKWSHLFFFWSRGVGIGGGGGGGLEHPPTLISSVFFFFGQADIICLDRPDFFGSLTWVSLSFGLTLSLSFFLYKTLSLSLILI